jgi:hypothetical protein
MEHHGNLSWRNLKQQQAEERMMENASSDDDGSVGDVEYEEFVEEEDDEGSEYLEEEFVLEEEEVEVTESEAVEEEEFVEQGHRNERVADGLVEEAEGVAYREQVTPALVSAPEKKKASDKLHEITPAGDTQLDDVVATAGAAAVREGEDESIPPKDEPEPVHLEPVLGEDPVDSNCNGKETQYGVPCSSDVEETTENSVSPMESEKLDAEPEPESTSDCATQENPKPDTVESASAASDELTVQEDFVEETVETEPVVELDEIENKEDDSKGDEATSRDAKVEAAATPVPSQQEPPKSPARKSFLADTNRDGSLGWEKPKWATKSPLKNKGSVNVPISPEKKYEWEKPSWTQSKLKSTGKDLRKGVDLQAPITHCKKNDMDAINFEANPMVLKHTGKGTDVRMGENLAKPITHVPREHLIADVNFEANPTVLKSTDKGYSVRMGENLARPITFINGKEPSEENCIFGKKQMC